MPFGIPPSRPVADSAGDYAYSSGQELGDLANTVVSPVSEQIEGIENILASYKRAISKAARAVANATAKDAAQAASTLSGVIGYVAQETSSYVGQLSGSIVASQTVAMPTPNADQTPANSPLQFVVPVKPEPPPKPAQAPYCPVFVAPGTLGGQSNYQPPKPPSSKSKVPCPTAPEVLLGLGSPIGTKEWCAATELSIDWIESLGSKLSEWAEGVVNPEQWQQWILSWPIPDAWAYWVKAMVESVKTLLSTTAWVVGSSLQIVQDIIKCAWYYTQVVSPTKRPGAMLGVLVIRNIIKWLRGTRFGSQSYVGVTVVASLDIPDLDSWLDEMTAYLSPREIPSLAEVREAWLKGRITDPSHIECLMRLNGCNPNTWWLYFDASQEQLGVEETIEYARRHNATVVQQMEALRPLGYTSGRTQAARLQLYDELPSVQDHLHWLQKNVFDEDYVKKYQLDSGFEDRFWSAFGADLNAQGYTKSRAQKEYQAHWVMPSPHQMQEMVYRLRPGAQGVTNPFTADDYEKILAEQDYNPLARKWFRQIVYRVPALSYVRDMHRLGVISDAEMQGYHQDLGYTEQDAKRFTATDVVRKSRMRAQQGSGWTPSAIRKASSIGLMPETEVVQRMESLGFNKEDAAYVIERGKSDLQYRVLSRAISTEISATIRQVKDALTVGVMDAESAASALASMGWSESQSKGIAALTLAQANTSRVKSAVARIKRSYTDGTVDHDGAQMALQSLGIKDHAISSYLAVWKIELDASARRLTVSQIVKEVTEGVLSPDEAKVRLHNLGYSDGDILIFIGDAARQTVSTNAALLALDSIQGNRRSQQLSSLATSTIGLSRRIVSQLKAQEPPSKLMKWAVAGIVSESDMRSRLSLYGWDDSSIDKWVQEAVDGGAWSTPHEE